MRVAVQDMLVTVAINGQTAACFNLDRFADGSYDYRDNTAGGVSLFYTLSLTGHTWQAHMSDLHQPVERFMCELGSQCSSNISSLAQDRRIEWRSTQDGGIEFGRFAARDDLGVFAENIFSDVGSRSSSELATHYQVAGPDKKGSLINIAAARKYGYRFMAGISSLANTSEEALAEADKGLSEELRQIEERRVESIGFMQAQPGDQLTMAYDARNDPRYAGGDVPHTNATYVLDGAKLTWNDDGCAANMQLSLMNPV